MRRPAFQTIIGIGFSVLSLLALSVFACDGTQADEALTTTSPQSAAAAAPTTTVPASTSTTQPLAPPITITDLYDNHALQSGLKGDWGFACLIEGYEQTILFDTGSDGSILLSNMTVLGIDPLDVDVVVLSHEHGDHTRGLSAVLARNPDVTVYCPASFSQSFTRSVEATGATVIRVDSPISPCPGAIVTAPMPGGSVNEQGLLLITVQGPVFITGCAHPGVVAMAEAATDFARQPLLAVLGGFHLYKDSDSQVRAVIHRLQDLGVQQCGPSHCTGDRATALFKEAFGPGFIRMGVGAVLEF